MWEGKEGTLLVFVSYMLNKNFKNIVECIGSMTSHIALLRTGLDLCEQEPGSLRKEENIKSIPAWV